MRYYRGKWAPGVVFCRSGNGKKEKKLAEEGLEAIPAIPEGMERLCWLFEREPGNCRGSFAVSREPEVAILQMAQKEEGVFWLNRRILRDKALHGESAFEAGAGSGAASEAEFWFDGEMGRNADFETGSLFDFSVKNEPGSESEIGIKSGFRTGAEVETGRRTEKEILDAAFLDYVKKGLVRGVNLAHPRWKNAAVWKPVSGKKRVHILAMGDVGSMLLVGLKLLGADVIETIGIWDMNEAAAAYWACEMNQAMYPWDYERMPEVEVIKKEQLFDCDVFLFCASKSVPPVGTTVSDVRMVQFEANAAIVKEYGKMAREKGFRGLFGVVSDPVDPLCKAVYLESNRDEAGRFDGKGLLPEQVQGFGLGVMNARAAYFSKRDSRFASFLREGRSYGPHGEDLVIANSLKAYDDQLSQELTHLAVTANLKVRELGFKPYVAPALSSGALSVLLMLRGDWHYSSTFLGGVFMGAKNRFTPMGLETECEEIPEALFSRIQRAASRLKKIL